MGEALFRECEACEGMGNAPFEQKDKYHVATVSFGNLLDCSECDGWGFTRTAGGQAVMDLILAMKHSPKWR